MITIGIYTENPHFISELYETLNSFMQRVSDWQLCTYRNNLEILQAMEHHHFNCNLLLLDIQSKPSTGVDIAQYVHEHKIDTDIIFISSSKEHILECYQYNTFAYMLKPLSKTDILTEVSKYLTELKLNPKCLNVSIKGINHQIPLHSILYIESNARKVSIYTKEKRYDCYQRLDDMANLLQEEAFIRCHQSYLVSADKITARSHSELKLSDITLPVSRKYLPRVRSALATTSLNEKVNPSCYLTSSLNCNREPSGSIIGIKGPYIGSIIRIRPEQTITIGRDGKTSDMIINLPRVSRIHCQITYHADENTYTVTDFSRNGTFIQESQRLVRNEVYTLTSGSTISFGNKETVFQLG